MHTRRRPVSIALGIALFAAIVALPAANAEADETRRLVDVQQISAQVVASFPGTVDLAASEPDTLVEPDIAVSPRNSAIAVAVSHESRFPDGGAVAISHAWTRDGGVTWRHASVTGLTTATGGVWDRVSDPVLAFAPDGSVYLSTIAFNSALTDCRSVVLVSRSTDGGAKFGPPVTAQSTNDCQLFNDKNWIVVDNGRRSAHRGRIYQFWTLFTADTADQTVRWSDDKGRTWSDAVQVSPPSTLGTQNSQPMIADDGTIVDTYLDFTFSPRPVEDPRKGVDQAVAAGNRAAAISAAGSPGLRILAVRSVDGGASWSTDPVEVATHVGFGPDDVRCCLDAGTIDPQTGRLFIAWISEDSRSVLTSRSREGRRWTAPRAVTRGTALQRVNVDIASYSDHVTVSYATRDLGVAAGQFWQQQVSTSSNGGEEYDAPQAIGPAYDSRFGAFAGATFPGDYIGTAAGEGRTYLVWAVASTPPDPGATFHQVLYGAVVRS